MVVWRNLSRTRRERRWRRVAIALGKPRERSVPGSGDNAGDEKDILICHGNRFDPQCHGLWSLPEWLVRASHDGHSGGGANATVHARLPARLLPTPVRSLLRWHSDVGWLRGRCDDGSRYGWRLRLRSLGGRRRLLNCLDGPTRRVNPIERNLARSCAGDSGAAPALRRFSREVARAVLDRLAFVRRDGVVAHA